MILRMINADSTFSIIAIEQFISATLIILSLENVLIKYAKMRDFIFYTV